jgi:hypothetical protein
MSQTTTKFFFVSLDGPSFDGILRIAVTPTVAKEILTCEKHSLTSNVYQLRHAIWSLEIILTIRNSCGLHSMNWNYCGVDVLTARQRAAK